MHGQARRRDADRQQVLVAALAESLAVDLALGDDADDALRAPAGRAAISIGPVAHPEGQSPYGWVPALTLWKLSASCRVSLCQGGSEPNLLFIFTINLILIPITVA